MWFGGSVKGSCAGKRPESSLPVWTDSDRIWHSERWPRYEMKTARHGERRIVVFGPCGATTGELRTLAASGIPDDVAWRWPGSYTVVQSDSVGTTVWTDLGWACPVYTFTDPADEGNTVWASSSLLLASLNGYRPDHGQLVDRLIDPDLGESAANRSWFAGVQRVPPGYRLALADGERIEQRRMWNPRQDHGANHSARLRTELDASVHLRVGSARAPSCDLSGGFDSTALALIAGEYLRPRRGHVVGVTVHPAEAVTGGDLDYAREAGTHPGIRHLWMPLTDAHAPYQRMHALPVTDEPAPSAVSHAYLSAQFRWLADEHGCDVHLTGDGGDGLLLTRASHLVDLAATGKLPRAVRETALFAQVRRRSWREVLSEARNGTSQVRSRSWVTAESEGQRRSVAGLFDPRTRLQREVIAAITAAGRTAHSDAQIARTCGIALHNPYFDSRVIDTCLAVPTADLPGPARYKPLMADAMRDLYPPSLARRTTKGDACADHYGGLRRALPELLEFMDGKLAAAGLIDVPKLRQVMAITAAGLSGDLHPIETAVATEAWLRSVSAQPEIAWRLNRTEEPV